MRLGTCAQGSNQGNADIASRAALILALPLAIGTLYFPTGCSETEPNPFRCVISVNTDVKGPLHVDFSVQNISNRPLWLLKWATPLESTQLNAHQFDVFHKGNRIVYTGRTVFRPPPNPLDYVYLKPGVSVSTTIRLTRSYDLSQPGEYRIRYRQFIGYQRRGDLDWDDLKQANVISNEIAVIVGEGEGGGFICYPGER